MTRPTPDWRSRGICPTAAGTPWFPIGPPLPEHTPTSCPHCAVRRRDLARGADVRDAPDASGWDEARDGDWATSSDTGSDDGFDAGT